MYYLGFDIGGSSVKAVLVKNDKIVNQRYEKLPATFSELAELVASLKEDIAKPHKIKGIGFSFAGALDAKREKMICSYNIPYLNKKPLKKIFRQKLGCENIKVEHDINCFLLAETKTGLSQRHKNIFYLTLGTGIGSAFMVNGEIITGSHGSTGELGHMITDFERKIRFEDIAANKFIKKKLGVYFSQARELAAGGNKKAITAFARLGRNLGIGLANIINIFDPGIIIIGGGVALAREFIVKDMQKSVNEFIISSEARKTKILWSKLGRFGGALGAALLVQHRI